MANLQTFNLRMVSWTLELVQAAIHDQKELERLIEVRISEGFPSEPVRKNILPSTLKHLESDSTYGQWSGLVVHKLDATAIGSMRFKAPPDAHGNVGIGYDIIPAYQGRGYATEMAKQLIHWVFNETSVRRVTAQCLESNGPSIRVLEKVGMSQLEPSGNLLNWELLK